MHQVHTIVQSNCEKLPLLKGHAVRLRATAVHVMLMLCGRRKTHMEGQEMGLQWTQCMQN